MCHFRLPSHLFAERTEIINRSKSNFQIFFGYCDLVIGYFCARAQVRGRKAGMTSNQHGPLTPWATRVLQWPIIKGCQPAMGSQSQKLGLSSDCRLQLACMKLESLVIVNQPRHGECVLGSCTHRPSHQESRQYQKAPG